MAFSVNELPFKVRYHESENAVHGVVSAYPRWKYHPVDAPEGIIVDTPEDEASLGEGWFDSLAAMGKETAPAVAPPHRRGPGRPRKA